MNEEEFNSKMRRGYSRPPMGRGYSGGGGRGFEQHRGGYRGAPRQSSRGIDSGHGGGGAHGAGAGAGAHHRGSSSGYMRDPGPSGTGMIGMHDQAMVGGGTRPSDPRDRSRIMGAMDHPQMGHEYDARMQDRNVGNYSANAVYDASQNSRFREHGEREKMHMSRQGLSSGPVAGPGAGRIGAGDYTGQYTERGPGVGRLERDSYMERERKQERRDYYPNVERADRFKSDLKSPNESSPEYFSTNYPTTELEEEEYGMYDQRRESEGGRRSRHDRGGSPEPYPEDEFEYECENPDTQSGNRQQSDIELSPDRGGRKSNMSDIELTPDERGLRSNNSDIDLSPEGGERGMRNEAEGPRSNRDLQDRKMDRSSGVDPVSRLTEDRDPHSGGSILESHSDDRGFERMERPSPAYGAMTTEDPRQRESRSRSSSLPRDQPVPDHKGREANATSVVIPYVLCTYDYLLRIGKMNEY